MGKLLESEVRELRTVALNNAIDYARIQYISNNAKHDVELTPEEISDMSEIFYQFLIKP